MPSTSSSSSSSIRVVYLLDQLADEWIVGLAQDWLNPREQRRFASTCRRFHELLPPPLQIQIASARTGGNMDCCRLGEGSLFVSRVIMDITVDDDAVRSAASAPLDISSPLEYNTPYYFWKFDYQEHCPVFLGRQLRQTQPKPAAAAAPADENDTTNTNTNNNTPTLMEYRFTLGLRPRYPNQYWKILQVNDTTSSGTTNTTTDESAAAAAAAMVAVAAGRPLQLIVSGWDRRSGQIDSTEPYKLTAQVQSTHSGRPIWAWHTVSQTTPDNKASAFENNDDTATTGSSSSIRNTTDLSFAYTTSHLIRRQRPESELFLLFPSSCSSSSSSSPLSPNQSKQQQQQPPPFAHRRRSKRSSASANTNMVTQTFPLEAYAIPDISDRGAYLLYSPRRWKSQLRPSSSRDKKEDDEEEDNALVGSRSSRRRGNGTSRSGTGLGRSAIVDFSFWSHHGILYFKAVSLPFALAIPVVQLDREYFGSNDNNNDNHSITSPDSIVDPQARPIVHLFDSFSARWGCIKYYMATAADVGEGCPLQLQHFLRGITDHDDHQVEYYQGNGSDSDTHIVSIVMKPQTQKQTQKHGSDDADDNTPQQRTEDPFSTVDQELVPDIERDDSQRWKFFFSW
jgi:hypothetical protein